MLRLLLSSQVLQYKDHKINTFTYIMYDLRCKKAVSNFLIGKLHKAGSVLFRCTKIRKSKSA